MNSVGGQVLGNGLIGMWLTMLRNRSMAQLEGERMKGPSWGIKELLLKLRILSSDS